MKLNTFQAAAGISAALATRWYPHVLRTMETYHIDTPTRQADFLAQLGHESAGFTRVVESMNYSPQGLMATFPRSRITAEDCRRLGRRAGETTVPLARQQEIANLVYGGRYGNNRAGDGWLYRGRGLKQVTFLANYKACGEALGIDLVRKPELLQDDQYAALSAGWFWALNGLSMFADAGDFVGQTKIINGGINGLDDRKARRANARQVLLA